MVEETLEAVKLVSPGHLLGSSSVEILLPVNPLNACRATQLANARTPPGGPWRTAC